MSMVELRRELNKVSMRDDEDPSTIFEQIRGVENQFRNTTISQDDLMATALAAAPTTYAGAITAVQLKDKTAFTLEVLEDTMSVQYRQMYGAKADSGQGSDVVLAAVQGLICYNCKKPGHRAKDCPDKKKSGGGGGNNNGGGKGRKFNGKCSHCGKIGHKNADCWDLHSEKAPKWYKEKKPSETGAAGVDGGSNEGVEILLMAKDVEKTFPDVAELLKDPNIWIGDTGASTHVTNNANGMLNLRNDSGGITMGNAKVEQATQVGDLPGTVCDKNGYQKSSVILKDVNVVPTSAFNLFSVSKLLKNGWNLSGTKESLVLSKGKSSVTFDIVINTPKGMIYATYLRRGSEVSGAVTDVRTKMSLKQAHERLGHIGKDDVRKTAKAVAVCS